MFILKVLLFLKQGYANNHFGNLANKYLYIMDIFDRIRQSVCEGTLEPIFVNKLSLEKVIQTTDNKDLHINKHGTKILISFIIISWILCSILLSIVLLILYLFPNHVIYSECLSLKALTMYFYNLIFIVETLFGVFLMYFNNKIGRLELCILGLLNLVFLTSYVKLSIFYVFILCRIPNILILFYIHSQLCCPIVYQDVKNAVLYIPEICKYIFTIDKLFFFIASFINSFEKLFKLSCFKDFVSTKSYIAMKLMESLSGIFVNFIFMPMHLIVQKTIFTHDDICIRKICTNFYLKIVFISIFIMLWYAILSQDVSRNYVNQFVTYISGNNVNVSGIDYHLYNTILLFEFLGAILALFNIVNKTLLNKKSKYFFMSFKCIFNIILFYFLSYYFNWSFWMVDFYTSLITTFITILYVFYTYLGIKNV